MWWHRFSYGKVRLQRPKRNRSAWHRSLSSEVDRFFICLIALKLAWSLFLLLDLIPSCLLALSLACSLFHLPDRSVTCLIALSLAWSLFQLPDRSFSYLIAPSLARSLFLFLVALSLAWSLFHLLDRSVICTSFGYLWNQASKVENKEMTEQENQRLGEQRWKSRSEMR